MPSLRRDPCLLPHDSGSAGTKAPLPRGAPDLEEGVCALSEDDSPGLEPRRFSAGHFFWGN
jgi:hypothetical protein